MKRLRNDILNIVKATAHGRPLRVGLFLRGNIALAQALSELPLRMVVMGDRFHRLYRYRRQVAHPQARVVVVETHPEHLPIAPLRLDILILARGMPAPFPPEKILASLRELLVDGGLLIWPHPIIDGSFKGPSRLFSPLRIGVSRAMARSEICSITMAAGFREVGQVVSKGRGALPWAITTGTAAFGWLPIPGAPSP